MQMCLCFASQQRRMPRVEHQRVGGVNDLACFGADQGIEDDWPEAVVGMRRIDAQHALAGFFHRIDEGHAGRLCRQALELREQGLAERLRRDAGTVGDEEHTALGGVGVGHGEASIDSLEFTG
jgi:hypothetical protein